MYYSNAIEKITVDSKAVKRIIEPGYRPRDVTDVKIIGYSKALTMMLDLADSKERLTPDMLSSVQNTMLREYDPNSARYRTVNRSHEGYGTMSAVKKPAGVDDIAPSLDALCADVEVSLIDEYIEPLLLIPVAISAFQQISPYEHGNGRMYRLILEYLMIRSGLDFVRYVSLDKQLFMDRKAHITAIYDMMRRKEQGINDPVPLIETFVSEAYAAAADLNLMFLPPSVNKVNKSERIRHVALGQNDEFTKSGLIDYLPGVSQTMIQQELSAMVKEGLLIRTGATKNSRYRPASDREGEWTEP